MDSCAGVIATGDGTQSSSERGCKSVVRATGRQPSIGQVWTGAPPAAHARYHRACSGSAARRSSGARESEDKGVASAPSSVTRPEAATMPKAISLLLLDTCRREARARERQQPMHEVGGTDRPWRGRVVRRPAARRRAPRALPRRDCAALGRTSAPRRALGVARGRASGHRERGAFASMSRIDGPAGNARSSTRRCPPAPGS